MAGKQVFRPWAGPDDVVRGSGDWARQLNDLARSADTELSFAFAADGAQYFQTRNACIVGDSASAGTGAFTYDYAADGSTFSNGVSLPIAMAAGSVLRVNATGVAGWATVVLNRLAKT